CDLDGWWPSAVQAREETLAVERLDEVVVDELLGRRVTGGGHLRRQGVEVVAESPRRREERLLPGWQGGLVGPLEQPGMVGLGVLADDRHRALLVLARDGDPLRYGLESAPHQLLVLRGPRAARGNARDDGGVLVIRGVVEQAHPRVLRTEAGRRTEHGR